MNRTDIIIVAFTTGFAIGGFVTLLMFDLKDFRKSMGRGPDARLEAKHKYLAAEYERLRRAHQRLLEQRPEDEADWWKNQDE